MKRYDFRSTVRLGGRTRPWMSTKVEISLEIIVSCVAIDRWSSVQRALALKAYYKNRIFSAQLAFCCKFNLPPRVPVPSHQATNLWVRKFQATASTTKKHGGSVKTSRPSENIERTSEALSKESEKISETAYNFIQISMFSSLFKSYCFTAAHCIKSPTWNCDSIISYFNSFGNPNC